MWLGLQRQEGQQKREEIRALTSNQVVLPAEDIILQNTVYGSEAVFGANFLTVLVRSTVV